MADRRTSYSLELGDRVNVCGQAFILTEVHLELNKAPKLTAKHLSEFAEPATPDFEPNPFNSGAVFGDRIEGIG